MVILTTVPSLNADASSCSSNPEQLFSLKIKDMLSFTLIFLYIHQLYTNTIQVDKITDIILE